VYLTNLKTVVFDKMNQNNEVKDMINDVNKTLKKYKKYDENTVINTNVDTGASPTKKLKFYNPMKYKDYIKYLIIPLITSVIIYLSKPDFVYDKNLEGTKILNKKKFAMSVIVLSIIAVVIYYIIKKYFKF